MVLGKAFLSLFFNIPPGVLMQHLLLLKAQKQLPCISTLEDELVSWGRWRRGWCLSIPYCWRQRASLLHLWQKGELLLQRWGWGRRYAFLFPLPDPYLTPYVKPGNCFKDPGSGLAVISITLALRGHAWWLHPVFAEVLCICHLGSRTCIWPEGKCVREHSLARSPPPPPFFLNVLEVLGSKGNICVFYRYVYVCACVCESFFITASGKTVFL